MPAATERSCVQPLVVCGPSQFDAGPWQDSQLTPSVESNVLARSASGTLRAWQARHFGAVSALADPSFSGPRIFAIRVATGFESTANACACLSLTTQVLYSFCCTEVVVRTCTPPWQLGEAHEPGPVYLGGSAVCPSSTADPSTSHTARRMFPLTIPDGQPSLQSSGASRL